MREGCMRPLVKRVLQLGISIVAISLAAHAGDGIVPVRQGGRLIFVNNDAAPHSASQSANQSATQSATRSVTQAASPSKNSQAAPEPLPATEEAAVPPRQLIYWSNTERRWKRVPQPSAAALRNARSAAQEVTQVVRNAPRGGALRAGASRLNASPDTQWLTAGRAISQQAVDAAIAAAAARHHVDANLVRSIIKVESNFNPHAVSRKGAMGLMQLMPSTARSLKVHNPFDPSQNIEGGVRHFKALLEDFGGDVELSLAAYNAGRGAVQRTGGVPNYRETREYVRRITEIYGGGNPFTTRSMIRESRDADGHRVYSND